MKRKYLIIAAVLLVLGVALFAIVLGGGTKEDTGGELGAKDRNSTDMKEPKVEPPQLTRTPPPAADLAQVELVAATVAIDADLAHGGFRGTVVNWGDSTPVPDAELTFLHEGSTVTVSADATGRFHFEPAAAGRYRLAVATADGFLPFAPEPGRSPIELVARPHKRVSGILVYLSPAIDYTGVVLDADGEPVAGAVITRAGVPGLSAMIPLDSEYKSGADGTFTFHAFDNTVFEASHPTAGFGRGVLGGSEQINHRMEIRLRPGVSHPDGIIKGRVVDSRRQPIGGALVRAVGMPGVRGAGPVPSIEVETGADGAFALAGLDDRPYRVSAFAEGYARRGEQVEPGKRALVLTLPDARVIRGRVVDAGGQSVASFTVAASEITGPLERGPGAMTSVFDGDGAFELTSLAAGEYAVVATAAGHAPSPEVKAEATSAEDARPISVTLPRGGTLTGVVVDARTKEALEGARVSTERRLGIGSTATPAIASAVTTSEGTFQLRGVSPGKTSVNVAAFAHHGKIVTGIEIPGPDPVGPITIALEPTAEGEKPKTEFAGIGCAIRAAGDGLRVRQVFPGSGCAEAKLEVDDVIVAVEGVPVVDLGFEPALQRLRGPAGTRVRVSMRRADEPTREITITRRKITL